jgi:CubicO group peptidase (beta-lactamase class C family)
MKNFLVLLSVFFVTHSAHAFTNQEKSAKINDLMNSYYNNGLFDGVVLVSQKGSVIYQKAFGIADRDWNIPMTTDTKFRIASLSKAFTAFLILQLVQDGLVSLDGTIADYIPDYQGKYKDRITIHQLLTHTSGIISMIKPEEEAIQERLYHDLRDLIRYAEEADLICEPGTEFHYSNFGYNILAYIAERVANKPFGVLLNERIFVPVGLNDTRQAVDSQIEERLARGYEYKLLYGYENASNFDNSYSVGCGGLISTAKDLLKWHLFLLSDQLLSHELKAKMFEPTSSQYGYGWGLRKKAFSQSTDTLKIAEHSGSINGFGSYIAHIQQDTTCVIVLKNYRTDTYISPAFAPAIGDEIISVLYGDQVQVEKKSMARHFGFFLGRYGFKDAQDEYFRIKKLEFENYNMDESELNKLGIELYFKFNLIDDALKVFELNMTEFPKSYNTYDSYAYILMKKGDYKNSILYYQKGLQILKEYPAPNGGDSVKKDAAKAIEYIKEMQEHLEKKS